MSRTVPAALLTALGQSEIQPYLAVEFLFDSGPLRLWTGYGDKTVAGNTYTGGGTLLSIDGLGEVSDLSAKSITITLSGMPAAVISAAIQEPYQRRKCRVYLGEISVSDVVEIFSGSLNNMNIQDSAQDGEVSVVVDSKLVELERSSGRRYTSENQKSRYPSDTFFDYVSSIQDADIVWGRKI